MVNFAHLDSQKNATFKKNCLKLRMDSKKICRSISEATADDFLEEIKKKRKFVRNNSVRNCRINFPKYFDISYRRSFQ